MNIILFITTLGVMVFESFDLTDSYKLEPLQPDKRMQKLVGGVNSLIEDFPYLVALELSEESSIYLHCGGSILSPFYVLTAAHCLNKTFAASSYQVRAGSSFKGHGGTLHLVRKYIMHDKYGRDKLGILYNDVALLRLINPIKFDSNRQPIVMFETGEETKHGEIATVAGWGKLSLDGPYPEILQSLEYNIVDRMQCTKSYEIYDYIYEGEICAAESSKEEQSICLGDSGGPLVINGRLAGITSFIVGCWSHPNPNVFTEIAFYREWIESKMPELNEV